MEERFYFENLLNMSKSLTSVLYNATVEASTPDVRNTYNTLLFNALEVQNAVYKKMEEKGWYNSKPAPASKVKEVTYSSL